MGPKTPKIEKPKPQPVADEGQAKVDATAREQARKRSRAANILVDEETSVTTRRGGKTARDVLGY